MSGFFFFSWVQTFCAQKVGKQWDGNAIKLELFLLEMKINNQEHMDNKLIL
jgi:hypothetical protein